MAVVEKIKETRGFLEECVVEMQKVTWPDQDQLRNATIVVVLFTIAISAVIWAMDGAVSLIINFIMGIFGG